MLNADETILLIEDDRVDIMTVQRALKKNKIDAFHGTGRIEAAGKVTVTGDDGQSQALETKNIVIATGSDIARLPNIEIDEKTIVSSTGALELERVPGKMLVIGAGGLGAPVVLGLNTLDIGLATIGGLAIVLIAIVLDRITQSMGTTKKN